MEVTSMILATCDVCGRVFKEQTKHYYCEFCKKYFHICNHCKEEKAKCTQCGIHLVKKREPISINIKKSFNASLKV